MKRKIIAVCTTALLAVGALFGVVGAANATVAPCVPSDGVAAYDETVTDSEAHWQRYSAKGSWKEDYAPDFPSDSWVANVQGDPHGVGVAGPYSRSNEANGNVDFFYLEWVPAATHLVHHDAVPPVVCDPEDEPVLEIGGYCYSLLNAENPAAWENSGLQTFAAKKAGIEDWTTAEKFALCGLSPESCEPITIGFQSDWVSTEEGFEFPEHIQYPTDNIGWPPIYKANHTTLTQAQTDEETCDPPEIVQFSAPQFNVAERCDLEGSIITQAIAGVIWNVVFDKVTGNYTVDASPDTENNYAFNPEVQTHWEGSLGAFEPCPQIAPCDTQAVNPTATNTDPRGWDFEGAEWTKDGLVLTASNWSDAYAYHATNFKLSEASGLDLDLDIDGVGVFAVILQTAAGNVHWEPEPYSLDLWTNAPGILPASPGGQGGDYAGNLDDIIGDPTITGVYLYFSTGSETPVTATLHSGSYNCVTQPFAAAVVITTPPPTTPSLPIAGTNPLAPFIGAGAAILFGLVLAAGGTILRRRSHI